MLCSKQYARPLGQKVGFHKNKQSLEEISKSLLPQHDL